MKRGIVVAVSVAVALSLTGGNALAKSKKYYEFKLKAMPANILWGKTGDHTYVCIKKLKKKHGRYKTVRNYGCRSNTGRSSGGSTRGRWIVKGNSGKHGKNGALCTRKHEACVIKLWKNYGIDGVCHQEANRMLHGGRGILVNVYGDNEGLHTYRYFGSHGRHWNTCRSACY